MGQNEAQQTSSTSTNLPNGSTQPQPQQQQQQPQPQPPTQPSGSVNSRWAERVVLSDAKGTVRAVEFAPHHFGLKLVRFWFFNH